jgi:hypothetical protein
MKPQKKQDYKNLLLLILLGWFSIGEFGLADRIITRQVDWRAPAGGRIQEVRFRIKEQADQPEESILPAALGQTTYSNVIDSPPIDGFVPWIAVQPPTAGWGIWNWMPSLNPPLWASTLLPNLNPISSSASSTPAPAPM